MKIKSTFQLTVVAVIGLTTFSYPLATAHAQGSLTPPAGPPAPTMKTLDQLEPRIPIGPDTTPGDDDQLPSLYKITAPGSYYLTGHVTGVSNKCGLKIVASDVTVDLGEFTLAGAVGTRMGIYIPSGTSRISIRNGTIRDWANHDGIQAWGDEIRLSNLHVLSNGLHGVRISGSSVVTDCTATGHQGDVGFKVGPRSQLTRVTARLGNIGIEAGSESSLLDCVGTDNTAIGLKAGYDSILTRCAARYNHTGFNASGTFTGCVAQNNTGIGFTGYGLFDLCWASWNGMHGFSVSGATVINCEAISNGEHGIYVTGSGSRIAGNRCVNNGRSITNGAGIYLVSATDAGRHEVANNLCKENDHGMAVHSSHNRIADNSLVDNGVYGLTVTGQYNLIIRNTARNVGIGAVNWNIAPLNRAGAYVAPANNAAINGNTGGNGSGTTDPFANISF